MYHLDVYIKKTIMCKGLDVPAVPNMNRIFNCISFVWQWAGRDGYWGEGLSIKLSKLSISADDPVNITQVKVNIFAVNILEKSLKMCIVLLKKFGISMQGLNYLYKYGCGTSSSYKWSLNWVNYGAYDWWVQHYLHELTITV